MSLGIWILIIILGGIVFGCISACACNNSEMDTITGFLLGFLFGFLGFCATVACVLPTKQNVHKIVNNDKDNLIPEPGVEHVNFCKACGYQLFDDDVECPICHTKKQNKEIDKK